MCAHFIIIPQDELERIIADIRSALQAERRGDAAILYDHAYPKSRVPILTGENGHPEIHDMHWGYQVSWQNEVMFNAKIETALGKKPNMWDNSIQRRRCVVPSFGFYEPHMKDTHISPKTGRPVKDQYRFRLPGNDILWMAGIYEDRNFSVMTTAPNGWVKPVHARMPVVLRPDELDVWLYGDYPSLANRDKVELTAHNTSKAA